MKYKTSLEVAEALGITRQAVMIYTKKYGIGKKFYGRWLFTDKDIEKIRNTDGRRKAK